MREGGRQGKREGKGEREGGKERGRVDKIKSFRLDVYCLLSSQTLPVSYSYYVAWE